MEMTGELVDDTEAHKARMFTAFQAALAQGLTESQIETAMNAVREEYPKWIGTHSDDWREPIAALVRAALRAL